MSNKLTIEELNYVQSEVRMKGKSLPVSYALLLTFGLFGIHLGYLERTKSAILRAFLTIITAGLLYPITKILIEFNSSGATTQLQQYASTFLVIAVIMIGINAIWAMYDLVSLPTMVKEINNKIEERFSIKAVEARYVKESLIKDSVSDYLVEKTSNQISNEVQTFIESEKEVVINNLVQVEKDLISKREEILDLAEHVSSSLDTLKESYENFGALHEEIEVDYKKQKILVDELNQKFQSLTLKNYSEESIKDGIQNPTVSSTPVSTKDEDVLIESENEVLTVDQAIKEGSEGQSVKGYIVGNMSPNRQTVFFDYFDNEMNVAIADKPEETDRKKMIIVQLTWGSGLRTKLGLITNKNNLKRPILIKGDVVDYFKGSGMKDIISVEFLDTKDKFISNDIKMTKNDISICKKLGGR